MADLWDQMRVKRGRAVAPITFGTAEADTFGFQQKHARAPLRPSEARRSRNTL